MQYTAQLTENTSCTLTISLTEKEVQKYMDKALKALKKTAPKDFSFAYADNYPEFLENVTKKATEKFVPDFVSEALGTEKLYAVSKPLWQEQELPRYQQAYTFTVKIDVLPDLAFPKDFSRISLTIPEPDAPQNEVFTCIEQLMQPATKLQEVDEDRTPKLGDLAVVYVKTVDNAVRFNEFNEKEITLPVTYASPKGILKDILQTACTLKKGEQKECVVSCPAHYPDPHLRGKEIKLSVELKKLYRRNIPALTDELAKQLGFADAKTLKVKAYTTVMNENILERRSKANETLFQELLADTNVVVPNAIYQYFLMEYLRAMKDYLEYAKYDKEYIAEALKSAQQNDQAHIMENAKRHTYLLAYAYKNNINAAEKDIEKSLKDIAEQNKISIAEVRRQFEANNMLDSITEQIMANKAFEKIYGQVKKIMVDKNGNVIPQQNTAAPKK